MGHDSWSAIMVMVIIIIRNSKPMVKFIVKAARFAQPERYQITVVIVKILGKPMVKGKITKVHLR